MFTSLLQVNKWKENVYVKCQGPVNKKGYKLYGNKHYTENKVNNIHVRGNTSIWKIGNGKRKKRVVFIGTWLNSFIKEIIIFRLLMIVYN